MPARRYICSPQGAGPLTFSGATLPGATMGVPYALLTVAPFAKSGVPPYTFSVVFQTGPDNWSVNPATGVLSATPTPPSLLVAGGGAGYLIDGANNVLTSFYPAGH